MTTLYLRSDNMAVEPEFPMPEMNHFGDNDYPGYSMFDSNGYNKALQEFSDHLASLPGIHVSAEYLATHPVGWMKDDWEEGYENYEQGRWQICSKEYFDSEVEEHRRKVIIPRTSHVEDAGECRGKVRLFYVQQFAEWLSAVDTSKYHDNPGRLINHIIEKLILFSAATHPLHVEDKREEMRNALEEIAELFDKPEYGTDTDQYRAWSIANNALTTPPLQEGERVEKEVLAKEYADKVKKGLPDDPYDSFLAGYTAALSTRGKDAVELTKKEYDDLKRDAEQWRTQLKEIYKNK